MVPSAPDSFEAEQAADGRANLIPEVTLSKQPSILIATTDPEIRSHMMELFHHYQITTLWASGLEEIKSAVAKSDVAACFCGFWLVDGTYRDVVRHLKCRRPEIPVVIVCAPACPQEYRDYLAALNIRAFDFMCYPYRSTDLERILNSAIALRPRPVPAWSAGALGGPLGSSDLLPAG